MRYLGKIYTGLKEANVKHMMHIIERDILLRSFKHIFNEILKDTQLQYIPELIAHLLNCLLGSEVLVKALNNRKIKPDSIDYPEINRVNDVEGQQEKDKKKKKKDSKKKEETKEEEDSSEFKFHVTKFFNESFNSLIENRKIETCKGL